MIMKKSILILSLFLIPFGVIKSIPVSIKKVTETQIRLLTDEKSRSWEKTDSINVYFNLDENILIFKKNKMQSFDIIDSSITNYEICKVYNLKGVDEKNEKYDIEVYHFNDNSLFMSIYGKETILRYKFENIN